MFEVFKTWKISVVKKKKTNLSEIVFDKAFTDKLLSLGGHIIHGNVQKIVPYNMVLRLL